MRLRNGKVALEVDVCIGGGVAGQVIAEVLRQRADTRRR